VVPEAREWEEKAKKRAEEKAAKAKAESEMSMELKRTMSKKIEHVGTWEKYYYGSTGEVFYVNMETGASQWEAPAGFKPHEKVDPRKVAKEAAEKAAAKAKKLQAEWDEWEKEEQEKWEAQQQKEKEEWEKWEREALAAQKEQEALDAKQWALRRTKSTVKMRAGNWSKHYYGGTGEVFFVNNETGESQWELPDGFLEDEGAETGKGSSEAALADYWGSRRGKSFKVGAMGDWEVCKDMCTNQTFYYNRKSGGSTWNKPTELADVAEGDEAAAAAMQLKGATRAIHAVVRLANFGAGGAGGSHDSGRRPSLLSRRPSLSLEMDLIEMDLSADALGATFVPTPAPDGGGFAGDGRLGFTPKAGGASGITPKAGRGTTPKARRGTTPKARRGFTPKAGGGFSPKGKKKKPRTPKRKTPRTPKKSTLSKGGGGASGSRGVLL
jgi:hypothetical protein